MQSPQLVFSVVDFVVLVVAFAVFPHLMPFFSSTAVTAFGADLYYLGTVCPNNVAACSQCMVSWCKPIKFSNILAMNMVTVSGH